MLVTVGFTRQQRAALEKLLKDIPSPSEEKGKEDWIHALQFDVSSATLVPPIA